MRVYAVTVAVASPAVASAVAAAVLMLSILTLIDLYGCATVALHSGVVRTERHMLTSAALRPAARSVAARSLRYSGDSEKRLRTGT